MQETVVWKSMGVFNRREESFAGVLGFHCREVYTYTMPHTLQQTPQLLAAGRSERIM